MKAHEFCGEFRSEWPSPARTITTYLGEEIQFRAGCPCPDGSGCTGAHTMPDDGSCPHCREHGCAGANGAKF